MLFFTGLRWPYKMQYRNRIMSPVDHNGVQITCQNLYVFTFTNLGTKIVMWLEKYVISWRTTSSYNIAKYLIMATLK